MKRAIIALVFGLVAFFLLRHYQPSFAQELYNIGGVKIAAGWFVILGSSILGFILSGKK